MIIIDDPQGHREIAAADGRATLDDLFRRTALRRPDAMALTDPPNREAFTDGPPRRLTFAEADRMISAIAAMLRQMSLRGDAIVGLQIANTVESVLTLLAVLRAGLIVMPLPLLWGRAEIVSALSQVGAHALIVSGRIGKTNHVDLAMQLAAETFSVRFVCAFGRNSHDSVVSLDDVLASTKPGSPPLAQSVNAGPPGPGTRLAVVTWDVTSDGLVPVARSHAEVIAGGLAIPLESRLPQDAAILSTLPTSSFAGLATAIVPWLLTGGRLALHHPFDLATFATQCSASDTVIVPGVLAAALVEGGHLRDEHGVRRVIGIWRAPERLFRATPWQHSALALTDVQVFGEIGLLAARRDSSGLPATIKFGPVPAPSEEPGALIVAQLRRTESGTLALAGPMVPRTAFPAGAKRARLPTLKLLADGFTDTGYACRPDSMIVTGPPPGLMGVGGYRFLPRDLEAAVDGIDRAATLAALPDAPAGHRLAGAAGDRRQVAYELMRLGVNPLIPGAFHADGPAANDR